MYQVDKDEDMRVLLNESDYAFSILMDQGGAGNTDYADYTANHFIRAFRHVMQKPDLSRAQLASMLRQAERRKNRRDNDISWADFMARNLSKQANNNTTISEQ